MIFLKIDRKNLVSLLVSSFVSSPYFRSSLVQFPVCFVAAKKCDVFMTFQNKSMNYMQTRLKGKALLLPGLRWLCSSQVCWAGAVEVQHGLKRKYQTKVLVKDICHNRAVKPVSHSAAFFARIKNKVRRVWRRSLDKPAAWRWEQRGDSWWHNNNGYLLGSSLAVGQCVGDSSDEHQSSWDHEALVFPLLWLSVMSLLTPHRAKFNPHAASAWFSSVCRSRPCTLSSSCWTDTGPSGSRASRGKTTVCGSGYLSDHFIMFKFTSELLKTQETTTLLIHVQLNCVLSNKQKQNTEYWLLFLKKCPQNWSWSHLVLWFHLVTD